MIYRIINFILIKAIYMVNKSTRILINLGHSKRGYELPRYGKGKPMEPWSAPIVACPIPTSASKLGESTRRQSTRSPPPAGLGTPQSTSQKKKRWRQVRSAACGRSWPCHRARLRRRRLAMHYRTALGPAREPLVDVLADAGAGEAAGGGASP